MHDHNTLSSTFYSSGIGEKIMGLWVFVMGIIDIVHIIMGSIGLLEILVNLISQTVKKFKWLMYNQLISFFLN